MLTVLSVAYPLAPVGTDAVGGAEQVLWAIDAALVRAGHRSLVVACEGSRVEGELIACPLPDGPFDEPARQAAQARNADAIARCLAEERVDVVHLHGLDFAAYLPPPGPPVLATLHLPPAWYPPEVFRLGRPNTFLNCVSESQRRRCPDSPLLLGVVRNGVDLERFRFGRRKRGYALALGRVCPEKGLHHAVDAARKAGVPLLIAGEVFAYEAHQRYFDEQLAPRLDAQHRFLGRLDFDRKRRLLAGAQCLLVPSEVDETSSLVAMEALAAGTPVIAFPAGALPELIDHGRTGFIVRDADEMAEAISAARHLRTADCRRFAEAHLSAEQMTRRYLRIYEQLAARTGRGSASTAAGGGTPQFLDSALGASTSLGLNGLAVEVITTLSALDALRGEWSALADRCAATPFQRPEWLLPFARHFAPELRCLALRVDGELSALAPLAVDRGRLIFLGQGPSDYLDVLVDPALPAPGVLEALFHPVDLPLELDQLPAGSPVLALAEHGDFIAERERATPWPVLSLPLEEAISPSLARRLREAEERLQRLSAAFLVPSGDELDASLELLFALHAERWAARGEKGVLADATVQAFHREVARGFSARGELLLLVLEIGGAPAAALYGFFSGARAYLYLEGFSPRLRRLSPGALVIREAIGRARAVGAREIDFLRGQEPYKYEWGARDREALRLRLVKRPSAPRSSRREGSVSPALGSELRAREEGR